MKKIIFFISVLSFALSTTVNAATFFAFKSEPGDPVGKGESKYIDESVSRFINNFTLTYGNFSIIDKSNASWFGSLSAPTTDKLAPGVYKNTQRFSSKAYPSLDVYGYSGCNETSGEFKILDIGYDTNQKINSIAVDFAQHCDGQKPVFYGAYRYNSAVPNDLEEYIASVSLTSGMLLQSSPEDWVGQGKKIQLSDKDTAYDLNVAKFDNSISVRYDADGYWNFEIAAPAKNKITEGFYNNAQRYPFQGDNPGLSISGNGSGCDKIFGKFKVLEISYDENGKVKNLAVDFAQHCEDPATTQLTGAFRYHSHFPVNIYLPAKLKDTDLDLPFVQVDRQYLHFKLSIINVDPVTLKIISIEKTDVADNDIKVPATFSSRYKLLTIPQINFTDAFGKIQLIEDIKLLSKYDDVSVGDILTLSEQGNYLKLVSALKTVRK